MIGALFRLLTLPIWTIVWVFKARAVIRTGRPADVRRSEVWTEERPRKCGDRVLRGAQSADQVGWKAQARKTSLNCGAASLD